MSAFYRWLWYLVPANPLLVRIVQGGSRRTRDLWVRMGYLGALIILVLFGLLSGGGLGDQKGLNELAKAGTWVFVIIGYSQVILICLLAPLFMTGLIAAEQSGRTYNILLTTPLNNLQIILGALLGRLFFVLALLASGLPLFAVLLIFGGVPTCAVFKCFATSALVATLVGSVAVTLSVMRAAGRKAVFVFVISIVAYLVTSYLLDLALLRPTTALANSTTWLTPLNPLLVMEAIASRANYQPPSTDTLGTYSALARWYLSHPFAAFATLALGASIALTVLSTLLLRRVAQTDEGVSGPARFWLRLHGSRGERHRLARQVRGNPVAWREAHTRGNRTGRILTRWLFSVLGLGAAVLAIGLYHTGQIQSRAFQVMLTTLLLVELALIVLVALYMSAGAVSGEREDETMDLLLTTPITAKEYIWGKLHGLVRFLSMMLAVPIFTLVLVTAYSLVGSLSQWPQTVVSSPITWQQSPGIYKHPLMLVEIPMLATIIVIPFVAMCVMIGLGWSLKSRRVLGAVVPAVGLIGTLAVVMGFCGWKAANEAPIIGPIINAFSPATNLVMLVNPWERIYRFGAAPGTGRMTLTIACLVAGTGYSFVVYSLFQTQIKGFDHTMRRTSGTT